MENGTCWLQKYVPSLINGTDSSLWPWTSITPDQCVDLETLRTWGWVGYGNLMMLYPLFPSGTIGNLLIILTILVGKRLETKDIFDYCMLFIAILDLTFMLIKFPYHFMRIRYHIEPTLFFWGGGCGVMYSCSMMSDLTVLNLTIDRYFAVAQPIKYNQYRRARLIAWYVALSISFLLSMTRFHYAINADAVCGEGLPTRSKVWCDLKLYTLYFSDFVAPGLYAAIMIVLVYLILLTLRRRNKRVAEMSAETDEVLAQFRRTRSLLITLTTVYFLNQFGYMFYSLSLARFEHVPFGLNSTFEEAATYVKAKRLHEYSNFITNLMEVSSRALTFYAYVLFNKSFRGALFSVFRRQSDTLVPGAVSEIRGRTRSTSVGSSYNFRSRRNTSSTLAQEDFQHH